MCSVAASSSNRRDQRCAGPEAHVAVLLAALAVVKAGDYWLTRYELTTDSRGFVRGLLYSAAKAQLPAVMLLTLVALLVAGLFLSTLRTNSWRIPVVASALWAVIALIGGIIYPAAIQALVVNPNQRDKEAPYIAPTHRARHRTWHRQRQVGSASADTAAGDQ